MARLSRSVLLDRDVFVRLFYFTAPLWLWRRKQEHFRGWLLKLLSNSKVCGMTMHRSRMHRTVPVGSLYYPLGLSATARTKLIATSFMNFHFSVKGNQPSGLYRNKKQNDSEQSTPEVTHDLSDSQLRTSRRALPL